MKRDMGVERRVRIIGIVWAAGCIEVVAQQPPQHAPPKRARRNAHRVPVVSSHSHQAGAPWRESHRHGPQRRASAESNLKVCGEVVRSTAGINGVPDTLHYNSHPCAAVVGTLMRATTAGGLDVVSQTRTHGRPPALLAPCYDAMRCVVRKKCGCRVTLQANAAPGPAPPLPLVSYLPRSSQDPCWVKGQAAYDVVMALSKRG